MYNYATLSFSRKAFIDAAKELFPDIQDTITRNQINDVAVHSNMNFPQWLTNPANSVSRGIFKFPQPDDTIIKEPKQEESDESIANRIKDTYESMSLLIESIADNSITSLCISGGAGLGKSYTVNKILREYNGSDYGFVFHSGYLKASHLYRLLWENREKGQVIVIDDADIWGDETALQLCKAALELKETRTISWGSEKVFESQDGDIIPRYFSYEGSIIFLTNINIRKIISSDGKNAAHLSALESRSMVFDMNINSKREYLHIIKKKVNDGMLKGRGLSQSDGDRIVEFLEENMNHFRDLSLRMVEKIAILYKAKPNDWEKIVKSTFMS